MIELNSVTKLYGTVIGVNDVTSRLEPGAYGLLGPNGSGKTTLINLITGQLQPTLGSVRVFGESPWRSESISSKIGLCPAVEVLYHNVSALDWVRYLTELHGFGRAEAKERAERALAQVGMAGAMHRPMGEYSLGMRQRSKIAQSLSHEPDLLILDEPFNGLDPVGRHEMTALLRQWSADGKSLIFASHLLHEVEAISPSFLLICGGRLLASGTADEVYSLLADVPNQITISCDRPTELARRMIDQESIESIEFGDDRQTVTIATRSPLTVYEQLPGWIQETGIRVHELRSLDESLQSLFNTLMRIHRGEN